MFFYTAIIQEARRMVNMAEVCEENRGLVYAVAKRYRAACAADRAVDLEDLAQAGYIGLIEAARTFDETKGMFSTWATVYIRKELRAMLGLSRRDPRIEAISLDAEIGEDITLADTVEAPDNTEEAADQAELVQAVRETVNALPAPQNELVKRHDLQGQNLSAAGRACGLSASAASTAYVKARENLYRDASLRALAAAHRLDQRTDWHRQVGLTTFRSTWTSSTEALVFWREVERRKVERLAVRAAGGAVAGASASGRGNPPEEPKRVREAIRGQSVSMADSTGGW